jgi:hypothetical protein
MRRPGGGARSPATTSRIPRPRHERAAFHDLVAAPDKPGEAAAEGTLRPRPGFRCIAALALMILRSAAARAQQPDAAQQPEAQTDTVPQRDLMDVISRVLKGKPKVADTLRVPPKVVLTVLPSFSVNPSAGLSLGVSGNAVTRLGPAETTNLSTVSASVSYTTKKQFNILLRSNVFMRGNQAKFEGDWRYLDTNQPTYGLGPALPSEFEAPMDFKLARIYETVYFETAQNALVGLGYHLDYYFDIVDKNAEAGLPTSFLAYNNGRTVVQTVASGLSLNLLTDTRDNPINAKRGFYGRASLRVFPKWLGSDDDWQSLEAELRAYPALGKTGRSRIALWEYAWLTMGRPPYLNLPAIGWDYNNRTGRAYPQGRIRATNLLYSEAEYRITLSRNGMWGAVAFLNLTSASDSNTTALQAPNVGAGLGLRVKLNKNSDTNITLDFGFGARGSNGLFLGTSEAF